MDNDVQELGDILRQDAPPALDPWFRLAVLDRRARQVFRRRMAARVFAALAFTLGLAIAMQVSVDSVEVGGLLLVGGGLVLSWRCYAPVLAGWMRARLSESR